MSTITAAVGLSQLNKIEKLINLRRKNAKILNSKLKKISEITLPPEPKSFKHVYQLYSILTPNQTIRNQLQKYLSDNGIMSKVFFYPVHLTSFYQKLKKHSSLNATENISSRILSLPMYPNMTREELRLIYETIYAFFEKNCE